MTNKIRTYKRKLILTTEQSERIRSWIGACRVVYNLGLEIKTAAYKITGRSIHKYELMRQVTDLRKDVGWIRDTPAASLQASLEILDNSFKGFFRGSGYPKFASKKTFKSIRFKQNGGAIYVDGNCIIVPKIGGLKMFKDADIIGDIKNVCIKIEPTGFFACIQCDNVPQKFVSESQAIGLDMGLSHFCIDSNGKFIANPKHFQKHEKQLRIENRSLARKKKGSNGWNKQVKILALLHHKIANVRKDFLHKESTAISKQYTSVYMEDLNIKGMAKNHNLSKHILDAGWGMFRTMLSYKTNVVVVNAKYTSQKCNKCGHVDPLSRATQSRFCCTSCGCEDNADYNAAINIKGEGIAKSRKRESMDCALALNFNDASLNNSKSKTLTP